MELSIMSSRKLNELMFKEYQGKIASGRPDTGYYQFMASSHSKGVSKILEIPPISFGSLKPTHKAVVYFAELVPENY